MTKDLKKEKPKGTSIRLPNDILSKVEQIQVRERTDRTTVIVKAVEYWVSVDGKATCDGEFLKRLSQMESCIETLITLVKNSENEISQLRHSIEELKTLSVQQNTTINFLVDKVLDRK